MSGWPIAPLGDLATLEAGFACSKSKLVEDGLPHLRPFNIGPAGELDLSTTYCIPGEEAPASKRRLVAGDILFNNTNSLELVGKAAFVARDLDAGFSNHLTRVVVRRDRVEPGYALAVLDRLWREGYFQARATQWVSQAAFNGTALAGLPIPVPPLDEQRRIVDLLNRAAGIRRLREAALAKARDTIPALFLSTFGRPDYRGGWPLVRLGDLAANIPNAVRTGPFGSQLRHSEFVATGVPVLGIDNVVANEFRWAKDRCIPAERLSEFRRYIVRAGDVLITIMGTTGRVCVAPADLPTCISTKHLCAVTLDRSRVAPDFVWGAIRFDPETRARVAASGNGAIMEGWNMSLVRDLPLRLPPLEFQSAFAERLTDLRSIIAQQERALAIARDTERALMARLLG